MDQASQGETLAGVHKACLGSSCPAYPAPYLASCQAAFLEVLGTLHKVSLRIEQFATPVSRPLYAVYLVSYQGEGTQGDNPGS